MDGVCFCALLDLILMLVVQMRSITMDMLMVRDLL